MLLDPGYMGLGAYFDGENDQGVRIRESQPIVMRFTADVRQSCSGAFLPSLADSALCIIDA